MAVRPVLRIGDPRLLEVSSAVTDFKSPELANLIVDMFDTMAAENGAGIAAPQIGVNQRVVIFGIEDNPRYPDIDSVPTTVLINPEIEFLSDEMEDFWEGCLSLPGMRGLVPRRCHIRYRGVNENGHAIEREAKGMHARVVLHEVDHLDGILYHQRIKDLTQFGFEEELFGS